jgi:hypothetical protein
VSETPPPAGGVSTLTTTHMRGLKEARIKLNPLEDPVVCNKKVLGLLYIVIMLMFGSLCMMTMMMLVYQFHTWIGS